MDPASRCSIQSNTLLFRGGGSLIRAVFIQRHSAFPVQLNMQPQFTLTAFVFILETQTRDLAGARPLKLWPRLSKAGKSWRVPLFAKPLNEWSNPEIPGKGSAGKGFSAAGRGGRPPPPPPPPSPLLGSKVQVPNGI